MKVTAFTRQALKGRREYREMERQGYERCAPCWQLLRGHRCDEVLTDVRISADGKYVWYKTGPQPARVV